MRHSPRVHAPGLILLGLQLCAVTAVGCGIGQGVADRLPDSSSSSPGAPDRAPDPPSVPPGPVSTQPLPALQLIDAEENLENGIVHLGSDGHATGHAAGGAVLLRAALWAPPDSKGFVVRRLVVGLDGEPAIEHVVLVEDTAGNGTFNPEADPTLAGAVPANGNAELTLGTSGHRLEPGEALSFLVLGHLREGAAPGAVLRAVLTEGGVDASQEGTRASVAGRAAGSRLVVHADHSTHRAVHVDSDFRFTTTWSSSHSPGVITGYKPAWSGERTTMLLLKWRLSTLAPAFLNSLTLTADGTGDDAADVTALELLVDRDGDGMPSAADTVVAGPVRFGADDGQVRFASLSVLLRPTEPLLVAATFDPARQHRGGRTYRISLLRDQDAVAVGADGRPIELCGAPAFGQARIIYPWDRNTALQPRSTTGTLAPTGTWLFANGPGRLQLFLARQTPLVSPSQSSSGVWSTEGFGQIWSPARTLEAMPVQQTSWLSPAVVDLRRESGGVLHAMVDRGGEILHATHRQGGWSAIEIVGSAGAGAGAALGAVPARSAMRVHRDGSVHALWVDTSDFQRPEVIYRRRDAGGWGSPVVVYATPSTALRTATAIAVDMALGPDGSSHSVIYDAAAGRLQYAEITGGQVRPQIVATDPLAGITARAPTVSIAVGPDRVPNVIWAMLDPEHLSDRILHTYFSRRTGSGSWSAPARLSNNCAKPQEPEPVVVNDPRGHLYSAWKKRNAVFQGKEVDLLVFSWRDARTGIWSPPAEVSDPLVKSGSDGACGHESPADLPPELTLDEGGGVHLGWTASEGASGELEVEVLSLGEELDTPLN